MRTRQEVLLQNDWGQGEVHVEDMEIKKQRRSCIAV